MKASTSAMGTALARTDGQGFRVLLEITPAGGNTVYLCPEPITLGGNDYAGELLSSGSLTESAMKTSDVQVSILLNAANRAAVQLSAEVKLLLWAVGTLRTDADLMLWGEIADPLIIARGKISFDIVARSMRQNQPITRLVTTVDYPNADPDVIGQTKPVLYGKIDRQPCLAVDAGSITTVQAAVGLVDTILTVTDTSAFPAVGTLQCDIEQITYTAKTASTFTGCTRGVNGSQASPHDVAAIIAEVQSQYDYLVADHPVQAIDNVYVDGVRQSGADFVFFPDSNGKAYVRFYTLPTVVRQVNLGITDSIAVIDGISVVDGIVLNDGIAINDTLSITDTTFISDTINVNDGIQINDGLLVSDNITIASNQTAHLHSYNKPSNHVSTSANVFIAPLANYFIPWPGGVSVKGTWTITMITGPAEFWSGGVLRATFPGSGGTITVAVTASNPISSHIKSKATLGNIKFGSASMSGVATASSGSKTPAITSAKSGSAIRSGIVAKSGTVTKSGAVSKSGSVTQAGGVAKTGTVSKSGVVSKAGSITKTGTVVLTGNSVADTKIGGTITADVRGWTDDAAGTITGTANALIEQPDHIARHALNTYGGATLAEIPSNSFDSFSNMKLSISLTINIVVRDLLQRIAAECNALIAYSGDRWLMRDRTNGTASKTLTDADIVCQDSGASTLSEGRVGLRGIKNRYMWRAGLSTNRMHWAAAEESNDVLSQADYGVRAEHITLHDVHDQAQALAVINWKLARSANPNRAVITGSVLLNQYMLEVGDRVDVVSSKTGVNIQSDITSIKRQISGSKNGTLSITLEEL